MYETLAGLYDYYMDEVPYEKWLENMVGYFNKYGNNIKTVLDLGCGTAWAPRTGERYPHHSPRRPAGLGSGTGNPP